MTLTLNQPAKRNPISPAMRAALIGALEQVRPDLTIRSVIVTGAGKAFCSGLDLEMVTLSAENADPETELAENRADSISIRDFYNYLLSYPKPLIAAVNGPAVAGGAGVALVCDATILAANASFCFSEVRIGFVPAIVGVYLQSIIGVKKAKELMLSARTVSARESLLLGFAEEIVSDGQLMSACAVRAAQFARNGPEAMAATKRLIAAQFLSNNRIGMDLAVELNSRTRSSSECKEGVGSFLRKEKPTWCID